MLGAVYPALMLFVIVATGNHFWIDAAAGALVAGAAWVIARRLLEPSAAADAHAPAAA